VFYRKSGGVGIDNANYDHIQGRKLGNSGGGSSSSSEVKRIPNYPGPTNVTAKVVMKTTMTARERALAAVEK
jgi:hypothetical protein